MEKVQYAVIAASQSPTRGKELVCSAENGAVEGQLIVEEEPFVVCTRD